MKSWRRRLVMVHLTLVVACGGDRPAGPGAGDPPDSTESDHPGTGDGGEGEAAADGEGEGEGEGARGNPDLCADGIAHDDVCPSPGGAWLCGAPPWHEDVERTWHDGIDNDCDGETDEICTEPVFELPVRREFRRMGRIVASAGDVDADGVEDWAIAGDIFDGGRVEVRSGTDFGLLHEWERGPTGESGWLGVSMSVAGDVDQDGHADLLVTELLETDGGRVLVLSGRTGAELWRLSGDSAQAKFGATVALVGDVDGDEVGDHAVGGALGYPSIGGLLGTRVWLFSGANGSPIRNLLPDREVEGFGVLPVAVGDVDRDGVSDIAVPAVRDVSADVGKWRLVFVFSGADGSVIRSLPGRPPPDAPNALSPIVAGPGDLDGDGWPDVVVADPFGLGEPRFPEPRDVAVSAYSGRDGHKLWEIFQRAEFGPSGAAGSHMDAGCDIDGDGVHDIVRRS